MKKASLMLAAVAGIGLMLAGCDLEVRDKYVNSGKGEVTEDSGKYTLTTTNLSKYVATVDDESCIDLYAAGTGGSGTVTGLSSDNVKWDNPLAGQTLTGATITFDAYLDTTGTYSGVLGFYDVTTGGFLWFTDTQWFLNTNANTSTSAASFSYVDAVSMGTTTGKWQKIALVITSSGYDVYNAGTKIGSGTTLNGVNTSVSGMLDFLSNTADLVVAGVGVSFWDNSALASTYLRNIYVYNYALSSTQLATLFGTTITDSTSSSTTSDTTTMDILNVDVSDEADGRIGTVSATLNGASVLSGVDAQDGWWNHLNGTTVVQLTPGDTVVYTFAGTTASSDTYNSWYLHFWNAENTAGNLLRADNWIGNNLCTATDPGIWTAGNCSANGTYYNSFTAASSAAATSSDKFVLSVYFDGTNVNVKMWINNQLAYTVNSSKW